MNSFETLIKCLGNDYNPDYWSDHEKLRIGKQLDALGTEDWSRLEKRLQALPVRSRIRLAETSVLSERSRVIDLLVAMLRSPEPEVGRAVAESLLEKNYQWSPEVSLLADLHRHFDNAAPEGRAPIERLLARLPA